MAVIDDAYSAPGGLELGELLRQRGMTGLAKEGLPQVVIEHVDELACHPRAHRLGVQACLQEVEAMGPRHPLLEGADAGRRDG